MDTCICMDGSLQCLPEIITALLISCACMLNCFSHVWLFGILWTVGCQNPLSMEFSSKNTRVGSHSLLRGIFPTQGLKPGLLHCRQILYHLSHKGKYIANLSQWDSILRLVEPRTWLGEEIIPLGVPKKVGYTPQTAVSHLLRDTFWQFYIYMC